MFIEITVTKILKNSIIKKLKLYWYKFTMASVFEIAGANAF